MLVRMVSESMQAWYRTLSGQWGQQHWWPAESAIEVIAGAILTQNTAWTNVERALARVRERGLLSVEGLRAAETCELEELIRSSGYFRQKARRLKEFIRFLDTRHGGSLRRAFDQPLPTLRSQLLELNGIGPETADSIALYAAQQPVFVVDAYTRRILHRHAVLSYDTPYESIRLEFEQALGEEEPPTASFGDGRGSAHVPSSMSEQLRSPRAQVFNEMHAWIVGVGKRYCRRSEARCDECPLRLYLPSDGPRPLL